MVGPLLQAIRTDVWNVTRQSKYLNHHMKTVASFSGATMALVGGKHRFSGAGHHGYQPAIVKGPKFL